MCVSASDLERAWKDVLIFVPLTDLVSSSTVASFSKQCLILVMLLQNVQKKTQGAETHGPCEVPEAPFTSFSEPHFPACLGATKRPAFYSPMLLTGNPLTRQDISREKIF